MSMRHSQSSPSVAIEKGAYRIHTLKRSPSKLRNAQLQGKRTQLTAHEKRMATLIVFLVLATVLSFGSAFYLFSTRWESLAARPERTLSDARLLPQVVEFDRELGSASLDRSADYLSYLPHSGFHNQRIALENAIVLARLLNRTLLVPPVRLGAGIIRYYPFDHLYELVALSGKDHLRHCVNIKAWTTLPVNCVDYFDYTEVPWTWLSNITALEDPKLVHRWNMSDAWLRETLGITENETFAVKDTSPYHFRYVDADPLDMPGSRFADIVSISLLAQLPHRLIQVGTLFGSSRLRLRRRENLEIRKQVRESMVFINNILLGIANVIKSNLGGGYISAHIRLGDGHFLERGERNVRQIWWQLVHETLRLNEAETLLLESTITNSSISKPPVLQVDLAAIRTPHPAHPPLPRATIPRVPCRNPWYQDPRLSALNIPLFISTDVHDAPSHPLLRRFFDTFPCAFVLSDFSHEAAPLDRLQSGYDGLMLRGHLLPFLDAIIAGNAHELAVTDGSTFSQFVQDVLWRRYHDWEIVQRG